MQPDILIHQEIYREYSDEEINKAYASMEQHPNNVNMVKDNHFNNLAEDWVLRRYKKEDNEFFSDLLQKTITEQGF